MSAELFLVPIWLYNISQQKMQLLSELVRSEAWCSRQIVEMNILVKISVTPTFYRT